VDALEIRYESREVTVRGEPVELAPKEFELLRLMSANAGCWVHLDTIVGRLWDGDEKKRCLLRMLVGGLRRKLGDSAAEPTWIFNQRGVGYRVPGRDG